LLCLLTAMVSAWATSMGLILKQTNSLSAVMISLQLPLTLLSGVLLPLSLGPVWIRAIAHINPMYYTVEASRKLAAGLIANRETIVAFGVIVPLLIITLTWATAVYRKAVS
ncbi:MAG: ABC transporter permease, partial [Firmicutes bacterium]|nr:ABC transporter permease [Bacillota bacterium]